METPGTSEQRGQPMQRHGIMKNTRETKNRLKMHSPCNLWTYLLGNILHVKSSAKEFKRKVLKQKSE